MKIIILIYAVSFFATLIILLEDHFKVVKKHMIVNNKSYIEATKYLIRTDEQTMSVFSITMICLIPILNTFVVIFFICDNIKNHIEKIINEFMKKSIKTYSRCSLCDGSGMKKNNRCPACKGYGYTVKTKGRKHAR